MSGERVLVMIPTYDERESIGPVLDRLLEANPHVDALVIDDGSPDGTADLVESRLERDGRISLLRRESKDGLGAAYVAGIRWGLDRGYDVLVEMDADGSHPPESLPDLLAELRRGAELVIGSRWVPGGRVVDWPRHRELLSRGGNAYTRILLSLPVRDATAGYRAYRSELLRRLALDEIDSRGYCFQVDMTLRSLDAGARAVEVPIEFRERELGVSKMSGPIVVEAMIRVTRWAFERRVLRRG